jgi:hypothetical protein
MLKVNLDMIQIWFECVAYGNICIEEEVETIKIRKGCCEEKMKRLI